MPTRRLCSLSASWRESVPLLKSRSRLGVSHRVMMSNKPCISPTVPSRYARQAWSILPDRSFGGEEPNASVTRWHARHSLPPPRIPSQTHASTHHGVAAIAAGV